MNPLKFNLNYDTYPHHDRNKDVVDMLQFKVNYSNSHPFNSIVKLKVPFVSTKTKRGRPWPVILMYTQGGGRSSAGSPWTIEYPQPIELPHLALFQLDDIKNIDTEIKLIDKFGRVYTKHVKF